MEGSAPLVRLLAQDEVRLLRELAATHGAEAYLVGGVVRDALLGRSVRDFDFALGGMAEELPHLFAEGIGGSFFWLDREREQSRVVKKGDGALLTFDFAPLRGGSIGEDLARRDFTINSLALALDGDGSLIDPLHGETDLQRGIVRASSPAAFDDDPLRLLRAFRFAALLGFTLEALTLELIREKCDLLVRAAAERVRDEFFHILAAPGVAASLSALRDAGLLALIVPGATVGEAGTVLDRRIALAGEVELLAGDLNTHFPDLHREVAQCLRREMESGVTALSLVKLASLIGREEGGKTAAPVADRLRLGNRARRMLDILAGERPPLLAAGAKPAKRAMYRFFRDLEPAALELAILALADGSLSGEIAAELIAYRFREYVPEGKELLLSGDEVMALLGIGQGGGVGEAMELLREAESTGAVGNVEEARAFLVKNLLTKDGPVR